MAILREIHGIQRTCHVLATSRNRAVLSVLAAGLNSSSPEVRTSVIRAAFRRHDPETYKLVLRHYALLDDNDQSTVCDAHRRMRHHAAPVLAAAILKGDREVCPGACEIVARASDFEQFPNLVRAAENRSHACSADILFAIDRMSADLFAEAAHWAAGIRDGARDPSFTRHQLMVALEQSLERYAQHHRRKLLDTFLLLAPADNNTLLSILRQPSHPCHQPLVNALATSEDSGVMQRLIELLHDTQVPTAALEVIARRGDPQFLNVLLNELRHPVPVRVLHNMGRLKSVVWLEGHRRRLLELNGRAQAVAVELAEASGIDRESVFALLKLVLTEGLTEGRRASCKALAHYRGEEADQLVLEALDDPDAGVEAAALRQLRERRLPDALKLLVGRLESASAEVRDSARSSLREFNFDRYRAMFDLLDTETARATGRLVHRIDPSAIARLQDDLVSPSLTARLRAIEMALAMAAVDDIEAQLADLTRHENAAVRKDACLALGQCNVPHAGKALEAALNDEIAAVADAARQSLALRQARQIAIQQQTVIERRAIECD